MSSEEKKIEFHEDIHSNNFLYNLLSRENLETMDDNLTNITQATNNNASPEVQKKADKIMNDIQKLKDSIVNGRISQEKYTLALPVLKGYLEIVINNRDLFSDDAFRPVFAAFRYIKHDEMDGGKRRRRRKSRKKRGGTCEARKKKCKESKDRMEALGLKSAITCKPCPQEETERPSVKARSAEDIIAAARKRREERKKIESSSEKTESSTSRGRSVEEILAATRKRRQGDGGRRRRRKSKKKKKRRRRRKSTKKKKRRRRRKSRK